jgi:ABC-type glycerol-3-phosphate transport system substrate-binding protein
MSPYVHVFSETAATANNSWPGIPVSAYYADERDRAFEAVISGTKSAQQACDEMAANVQAELDKTAPWTRSSMSPMASASPFNPSI